jgi:hypothetical protein
MNLNSQADNSFVQFICAPTADSHWARPILSTDSELAPRFVRSDLGRDGDAGNPVIALASIDQPRMADM